MANLYGFVRALGKAAQLADVAQRVVEGDRAAGWDSLDVVLGRGAGFSARTAANTVRGLLAGDVIEGEYRELDPSRPPWLPFLRWLVSQRYGSVVVLGPMGQGKTTLAVKLADVWRQETDWPCEAVNLYPDDTAPFFRRVSTRTFYRRLRLISAYLDRDDGPANEGLPPLTEEETDDPVDLTGFDIDRLSRRIVLIDEASLLGSTLAGSKGRRMMLGAMAQARHLQWLVIYVAQTASMMPMQLLGTCTATFVKKPGGGEIWSDRQDELEIRALWGQAGEAFGVVRQTPWWEYWPDVRSWAYVQSRGHGYEGLIPFRPYGADVDAASEEASA